MQRFWTRLRHLLSHEDVALLTVVATTGSAPRAPGARMALARGGTTLGTVGGGAAEAACLEAARDCLATGTARRVEVDLRGTAARARLGVCGGTMSVFVTPLVGAREGPVLAEVVASLDAGVGLPLRTRIDAAPHLLRADAGVGAGDPSGAWDETPRPAPALWIAGAGHIGHALARMASDLDFELALFDDRRELLQPDALPGHVTLQSELRDAANWLTPRAGRSWVVLATRGFAADLAVLRGLDPLLAGLRYLGILGSARRIAVLRQECRAAGLGEWPSAVTRAPVGLPIGAETPEEIALSVLAEVVAVRRLGADRPRRCGSVQQPGEGRDLAHEGDHEQCHAGRIRPGAASPGVEPPAEGADQERHREPGGQ